MKRHPKNITITISFRKNCKKQYVCFLANFDMDAIGSYLVILFLVMAIFIYIYLPILVIKWLSTPPRHVSLKEQ